MQVASKDLVPKYMHAESSPEVVSKYHTIVSSCHHVKTGASAGEIVHITVDNASTQTLGCDNRKTSRSIHKHTACHPKSGSHLSVPLHVHVLHKGANTPMAKASFTNTLLAIPVHVHTLQNGASAIGVLASLCRTCTCSGTDNGEDLLHLD